MFDPTLIKHRITNETDYNIVGALNGLRPDGLPVQLGWHSGNASPAGVIAVSCIEVTGICRAKTHNAIEIDATAGGVGLIDVSQLWLHDLAIVGGEHGDALRVKGSATPQNAPRLDIHDCLFERLGPAYYPLFLGDGCFSEINVWNIGYTPTPATPGNPYGDWVQMLFGSMRCPIVRIFNCAARCWFPSGNPAGWINAVETDNANGNHLDVSGLGSNRVRIVNYPGSMKPATTPVVVTTTPVVTPPAVTPATPAKPAAIAAVKDVVVLLEDGTVLRFARV